MSKNTKKHGDGGKADEGIELLKKEELDEKGIPFKSGYPESPSIPLLYSLFTIIPGCVGLALAYLTSYLTESQKMSADSKISILSEYDLGWLYLGIFLVKLLQLPININLGQARKASKANVPDQHVYKVMGSKSESLGYVLMEKDGVHGAFNRAQRGLQQYNEQFPVIILQYVAASWIWPFGSFVCIVIWSLSSIISVNGYTQSKEGRQKGRLPGYFAIATLQGYILIAAYKALS